MKLNIILYGSRAASGRQVARENSGLAVELVYAGADVCSRMAAVRLFPCVPVIAEKNLREFDYGVLAGMEEGNPEADERFREWAAAGSEEPCPQGESPYQFAARCVRAFRGLADEMNAKGLECAALVADNAVIAAILRRYSIPRSACRDWRTSLLGGYLVEYDSTLFTAKIQRAI